jgi:hypothetical protein
MTEDERRYLARGIADAICNGPKGGNTVRDNLKAYGHIMPSKREAIRQANRKFWLMLIASVLIAVAGGLDGMPHPWNHLLSVAGLAGSAINGFLIRRP